MLHAVGERAADESLEARVIIGHVPALGEPDAKEPLGRAELEIDSAANLGA